MNVKMVYGTSIESYDTRADGTATTSRAVLEVSGDGRSLVLWSGLTFEDYDDDGNPVRPREERGTPTVVAEVSAPADGLVDLLETAGRESGLLRCDVDGETIWEIADTED